MNKLSQSIFSIGLFVGNDLTSHLIMNRLVKELIKDGHIVSLFLTYNKLNLNSFHELQKVFFYERSLLNNYLYPYLDKHPRNKQAKFTSPKHLKKVYRNRLFIYRVPDVNSVDFVKLLKKENITVGISIRCYQKFGENIIKYFQEKKQHPNFFVNLHPGLLPEYRGVTTFCRSMQNNEKKAGFTLHHINTSWDSGDIIYRRSKVLDYSISVIGNMSLQYKIASSMVLSAVHKTSAQQSLPSYPQSKKRARYYTHPSREDFIDFKEKRINLVSKKEIIDILLTNFTTKGSLEEKEIYMLLQTALQA